VLLVFAASSIVPYELNRAGRTPVVLAPPALARATTSTKRDICCVVSMLSAWSCVRSA